LGGDKTGNEKKQMSKTPPSRENVAKAAERHAWHDFSPQSITVEHITMSRANSMAFTAVFRQPEVV
jgi:hypothetical protein